MIGLLDYDALQQKKIRYPNLELMKMATYLRRNRQSVQIIVDLENLEFYSEIYLFQDDDSLPYPSSILRRRNVKWFGLAFSSGVHKPLDNEIEDCEPSISIYKLLFKDFIMKDQIKMEQVGYLLNASYVRLNRSLNKKYLKSIKKHRRVFVYDTEVFIGDWRKNADAILKRGAVGFNFIHPQHITDYELWFDITTNYSKNVFAKNYITLAFDFTPAKIAETAAIYPKLSDGKKTQFEWLRMEPTIREPFRQNTLAFAESIMQTAREGSAYPIRNSPFIGNPYHPFIHALARWRSSPQFYSINFIDFCESRKLYRERAFAIKIIGENKKYQQVFTEKPGNIAAMYGGLKSYDARKNTPSIYESYL